MTGNRPAYKTADYGKTWTKITNGIGATDFVHVVREDPQRPGLLYAGTEHGVYISFDDGAYWRSLSLNLPDTSVVDLVVEGADLVVATHGRSFWVLEGIGMLREWTGNIYATPVRLFTPEERLSELFARRPLIFGWSRKASMGRLKSWRPAEMS